MSSPAQADGRACTRDSTERSPLLPRSHSQLPGRAAEPWCVTVSEAQAFVAVVAATAAPAGGRKGAGEGATPKNLKKRGWPPHNGSAALSFLRVFPHNTKHL